MDSIEYFIEPIFKIEFFKIKCIDFKIKKVLLEKLLEQYPEKRYTNFFSNRNEINYTKDINNIFIDILKDELSLLKTKFNRNIEIQRLWSVTYDKGDYHVPHNHSSKGFTAILYLSMKKESPTTTYIQPFNDENDKTLLYTPDVEEGDIMIVPQFVLHYTEPNKLYFKKRILSFDFV